MFPYELTVVIFCVNLVDQNQTAFRANFVTSNTSKLGTVSEVGFVKSSFKDLCLISETFPNNLFFSVIKNAEYKTTLSYSSSLFSNL